jgi:hypothetical protein
MTEEQKPSVKPLGNPPMEYFYRLTTVDERTFIGECKKIAKTKEVESLQAVVALVLLGANAKRNDPYMLDSKSRSKGSGFNMQSSGPRVSKEITKEKGIAAAQAILSREAKKVAQ